MDEALLKIVKEGDDPERCIDMKALHARTRYCSVDALEAMPDDMWQRVRHLYMMWDSLWRSENLESGGYLSSDGEWLLVCGIPTKAAQGMVQRCGQGLELLDIRRGDGFSVDVSHITGLRTLRVDDFLGSGRHILTGVSGLTLLEELSLESCRLEDQLDISRMTELKKLSLEDIGLSQIIGIGRQHYLRVLHLWYVAWKDTLDLSAYPELRSLTIACNKEDAVSGLSELRELERLTLSGEGWGTKLDVSTLTKLRSLVIRNNARTLRQILGLEELEELEALHIDRAAIREIPEAIRGLKQLRRLQLERLTLNALPDWLPELGLPFLTSRAEKGIIFERVRIPDVDMSIFNQPQEVILQWFEERRRGNTVPLNEIKVVFLGDGEAGKSHTIARLMNDGGEPDHLVFDGQSTPGIVIRNKEYTVGDRKFTVHYWDFGGQEIMHSMHRIFLTGRTMYVILLNARDDTQSDRAKYWLHNVRSFAPDAPVLLVLNKIDQNPNASVDEKDLRGRYDKLTQIVRLSAKDFSREEFNSAFTDVLLEEIQKTGFLDAQWPISWTAVKEKLENMETHYIMGDVYEDICRDCQVDENQENLLHWFNDLGVSFCCRDAGDYALKDYVILRPDWITNALYIILFNRLEGARNGLIPHSSIFDILRDAHRDSAIRCTLPAARYNGNDIGYVLGIMRKFNLSFTDGHENEFIPMLCQQNSMVDVQYYQKDAEVLEFNMDFDYLPSNLLHRLMVERCSELDMTTVWRTGARFQLKELGYSAVVVIDGNALRFFIRHTDPMHRPNTYLTMLKAHVERIVRHMGLQPPTCQLIYKLDGKRDTFDLDILRMRLDVGQTYELAPSHKKLIPIADILNQSAPDGLEDEKKLLDAILRSCLHIQGERSYYSSDEDTRNRRLRDDLELLGYDVKDQSQRGLSGTGRGIGELDLLLYNDRKEPWTIIEALRVSGGTKVNWNDHLDKLVGNYNYFGAPCLYLLTYVDADVTEFERIWNGYRLHIPRIGPGKFTYCADSLVVLDPADGPRYVKTAKCRYDCGGQMTTAYHIFVQVPRQGESIL